MKSVVNSPAWNHIDNEIDTEFAIERRNLRRGLSLDGINPFLMQRSPHCIWLVIVILYNLPSRLVTKKSFVSLCLLIFGKESPTSDNIDIFLAPLIEEFLEFWEGIGISQGKGD
jgi:hypothetical protein